MNSSISIATLQSESLTFITFNTDVNLLHLLQMTRQLSGRCDDAASISVTVQTDSTKPLVCSLHIIIV